MSKDKPTISTVVNTTKNPVGKPKGSLKSGGRKKGTPNKKSVVLHEILTDSGVDIGKEIKKAFDYATPEQKIQLLKIVLDHFPKPAPVEIQPATAVPLTPMSQAQKTAKLGSV